MKFNYRWLLLIPVLLVAVALGILIPRLLSGEDDSGETAVITEGSLSAQDEEQVKQILDQIGNYETLLQATPDDVEVLKPLADDYSDLARIEKDSQLTNDSFKHYKAAVDNYRKILALQPGNAPVRLALALAYDGLLMRDVAYRELTNFTVDQLSAMETDDTELLIDAALLYQEGFRLLPQSETLLQKATTLEPDNARAWLSLGFVIKSEGRTDEANAAFNKVIEIDPDSDYAQGAREYLGQ